MNLFAYIYPYDLDGSSNKASTIRPTLMLKAFKSICNKELIAQLGQKRFYNLKEQGIKGLYLESINRPFFIQCLLEKRINIFSDYLYIRSLKQSGVKLSIYYRDAFWAGDLLFSLYFKPIAIILKLFYQLEWKFIKKYFDIIYVPSLDMIDYLGEERKSSYKVLLPGCTPPHNYSQPLIKPPKVINQTLQLLYVGGLQPPLNDISPLLKLIENNKGINLTLIVRKHELSTYIDHYHFNKYKNITIISYQNDKTLMSEYQKADASVMLYNEHPYRKLAMPYKAFESLSYGIPLISFSNTSIGDFILKNKLGICGSYDEINHLFKTPQILKKSLQAIIPEIKYYAENNTWEEKAKTVLKDINSYSQ
ncbi:MAG: hypothetical protein OQL19_07470 [Gammaproteobacteria bacterium]|nr:hypothetical protein [Gammaproteobacteria bacterium]